ncbi:unnamed protein product [Mesocestoides corti]|uniref:Secreted protein n=2 Tax=Mesocestoides corti TaxID=53468 RepID=A0A0R3URR9_MESCO|nr:unnamed protein product [Mesocestoides corti]
MPLRSIVELTTICLVMVWFQNGISCVEEKALLFEEALHRFCDAMSPTSTEATIEAPSSSSVKCGQDALAGDAPSHRASVLHDPACLRHLLAHISNLRNEIAVSESADNFVPRLLSSPSGQFIASLSSFTSGPLLEIHCGAQVND